ncbi:xyloglucan endotransglycosylase/hydrolase protein 8-like [Oryza brachyantha]|uniref:xyloglucan endotransglycosylase/hydrolase protein 8-like n=1 Tax=Oryza brachyantha TaxID=4533 RepID=UPI001ADAF430|nr:xyloglucan endotransglycosylase/hydrolase protein 8-like [Oryza brachyantha]
MARSLGKHEQQVAAAAAASALVIAVACCCFVAGCSAARGSGFHEEFDVIWGEDHVRVTDGAGRQVVTLTLDQSSGSGFQSKDQFLFGEFSMEMKLVPGESPGTVATFYLTSEGDAHDEIDFEFLGNVSGEPYVMHTNVFARGEGNREQQFYLWFDPTADFHSYTINWNPLNIIFSVDGKAVRVFKNNEAAGVPYPSGQAMRVHASLWNGDFFATRGGQVKINWTAAPFVSSYRTYAYSACAVPAAAGGGGGGPCSSGQANATSCDCGGAWMGQQLGPDGERDMAWARANYMIYDYCGDQWRQFPQGRPAECNLDQRSVDHRT